MFYCIINDMVFIVIKLLHVTVSNESSVGREIITLLVNVISGK